MLAVIGCIVTEHDLRLVLMAALVCVLAMGVTVQLLQRSAQVTGPQRAGWQFLAAVAGGGGVWTTHFVAMLAYKPNAPVSFDPALTVLSLVIAMVGIFAGFLVSGIGAGRLFPAIGGALAGLAFSAMHYTGMFAYRVVGIVEWRFVFVVASILLPVALSSLAIAMTWEGRSRSGRLWLPNAALVAGIVSLHFTAMTAFRVTPMAQNFPSLDQEAFLALAMAIALVSLIIVGTGFAAYLIDSHVRAHSRERLLLAATHDTLTGLANRAGFQEHLTRTLAQARATGARVALVGIDLNRFKEINDTLGHSAGDEALSLLAERMLLATHDSEFIARLGGDEFAGIKTIHDKAELEDFTGRLATLFDRRLRVGGMDMAVGASLGVAVWPDDAEDPDELVNNADVAMYHAKHTSGGGLCFYDAEIGAAVRKRRQIAEALRHALERDELEVHYQAQMSLETRAIQGYEALLRWTDPKLGRIPPSEFIPIAEESGLIIAVGAWVLRRACRDAAAWEPPCRVAVNVSAVQFMDSNLPRLVHEVLIETGLPPHRLELELTETALIKDKTRSVHIMRQIKALGVGVALDDFGSGYSSLETLKTFPFDKIKLDRAFVEGIEQDRQSKAIVRAVLALGKSLEIPVLAEGIETPQQVAILRQEGCDEGQGFLLGRPAPAADLQFLREAADTGTEDRKPRIAAA